MRFPVSIVDLSPEIVEALTLAVVMEFRLKNGSQVEFSDPVLGSSVVPESFCG